MLIGPPDLRADAVELGERVRVRMTVRVRLAQEWVLYHQGEDVHVRGWVGTRLSVAVSWTRAAAS